MPVRKEGHHFPITILEPSSRAANAKSPKRPASRTKSVDGITFAVRDPQHVRPGRKIKGGMETAVRLSISQHRYGVKLELDEKPTRIFINNRIYHLVDPMHDE